MTASLVNPVTGERIEFREVTDAGLRFDYYLEPGGFAMGRLDHVHPRQEEQFDVRAGRLGVRLDGDEWTATPGTRFAVPPDTAHTVWNDAPVETHVVIDIRPALDAKALFETMYGLARDGRTNRSGLPGPLQLAVIADGFREEFRFAGVPTPIQRGLSAMIAPIGRLAGYRARYSRYVTPPPEAR